MRLYRGGLYVLTGPLDAEAGRIVGRQVPVLGQRHFRRALGGLLQRDCWWGDHAELARGDVGHGVNCVLSVAVALAVVEDD